MRLIRGCEGREVLFTLSSKDILSFRNHLESVSTRNLPRCRVTCIFEMGNRVGPKLESGDQFQVAQAIKKVLREIAIRMGAGSSPASKTDVFCRFY